MSVNQSLGTLLRALRSSPQHEDVAQILQSATVLLTVLTNPLNVTILTSQLLCSPLLWARPASLSITLQFIGIFSSAAKELVRQDEGGLSLSNGYIQRSTFSKETWVASVLDGADEKSPRWRQLCAVAGVLIGSESDAAGDISLQTRHRLEDEIVQGVNEVLSDISDKHDMSSLSTMLVLGHTFHLLRHDRRCELKFDAIIRRLCYATLFSRSGFDSAYILSSINHDVVQTADSQFCWSSESQSFQKLKSLSHEPLLGAIGSLSLLGQSCIEQLEHEMTLRDVLNDLSTFARSVHIQWQQNKLCEIDISEEDHFLKATTRTGTLPLLWQVLRSANFHIVTLLHAMMRRVVLGLAYQNHFPVFFAREILKILRDTAFITSRGKSTASAQHRFITLSACDILAQDPTNASTLLEEIGQSQECQIPQHPMDRYSDLYFLNVAENFAWVLSPEANERLLIPAALPYLAIGGDSRLSDIFEAAHSVVLTIFSSGHNHELLRKYWTTYLDALFSSFPEALSERQFRMAVKTIIFALSSPSAAQTEGVLLHSTILEIIAQKVEHPSGIDLQLRLDVSEDRHLPPKTPQSIYLLSMMDSLVMLPFQDLQIWLPIIAQLVRNVQDNVQTQMCVERLWETLHSGEMDMERASYCIFWWTSCGGRESISQESKHANAP